MKKNILFTFIMALIGLVVSSQTTYTSPAGPGSAVVSGTAGWTGWAGWTPSGGGPPVTYVIQPTYSLIIGPVGNNSVDLSAFPNLTLTINGALGFYQGQNDLKLDAGATINIGAAGIIGWVHPSIAQCCEGNASNQITIGGAPDIMTGGFNYDGPQTATAGSLFNGSTEWTGATDQQWNVGTNWTYGVPTSTTNAIITDVANDPIIPAATYTVNRLGVVSPGVLQINSGGGLVVQNTLTNNGTITVKSGGSLVQTAASTLIPGTGTFNVERAITNGVQFIGSPIDNIAANGFGITPTGSNGGQIVPQAICSPTAIATGSPYGNLLELREDAALLSNCAQSLWHVKSTGNLDNGRGYSLNSAPTTLVFSGTVNNGTVSYANLTSTAPGPPSVTTQDGSLTTRGWHLVTNPYPSPITFNAAFLTGQGFAGEIHRYQHTGTYTGTWISNAPLVGSVTIPVGQSFQIYNPTGGNLTFSLTNAVRLVGNPTFYKLLLNDMLQITLNNGTLSDTTSIVFYPGATDNYDAALDAHRLVDGIENPMIYSYVNNERLSFNTLPVMTASSTKDVVVGVRTEVHGAHTLTFNGISTLTPSVILEDVKLNTFTPITEGYVYNFTTVAGDNRERFVLHFTADGLGIGTSNNNNFKLYPNPAAGTTSLFLETNHGFSSGAITDVCGKTIQVFTLAENDQTKVLDLSELNSGVYFVKLIGAGETSVVKLIKQ